MAGTLYAALQDGTLLPTRELSYYGRYNARQSDAQSQVGLFLIWQPPTMTMAGTPCPYMGSIGQDAETGWKDNMDMIPEGSVIYAKWNDEIKQIKIQEGVDSDASNFIKFVIAGLVMHSGIVMFFP